MRFVVQLFVLLCLAAPLAGAQSAPLPSDAAPGGPALGKVFRSRLAGIELNPPANGTLMRELNTGEIARFVYPDSGWDLRIKQIPSHVPLKLSSPNGDGVIELTVAQLTASNPTARIVRQDVVQIKDKAIGLIEARYNVGTDLVFAQQAIFCDTPQHYLLVQMSSRRDPKIAANQTDALETVARDTFTKMIPTVNLLDRAALFDEQVHRQFNTANLWVLFDRKKITETLRPVHFMRVVRNGNDIGFVQMNERLASRDGKEGIEVIVRSRVQNDPQSPPAKISLSKSEPGDNSLPAPALPPPAELKPAKPTNLFTNSTFFVSFDRVHEDWTGVSQTDDQVATQMVESGYSDQSTHVDPRLERAESVRERKTHTSHAKPSTQPINVKIPVYTLDVSFQQGKQQGKPVDLELPPYYLPQALGQLLARLLPDDPGQYMFAFYVSSERRVMSRYVDVDSARDVELNGQTVRAVPVSDRIGVDGIPTIHYVTRGGEWLGSVNDDQKLQVLATDEQTLSDIWKNDPLGFKAAPEPPPTEEQNTPDAPRLETREPLLTPDSSQFPDLNGR